MLEDVNVLKYLLNELKIAEESHEPNIVANNLLKAKINLFKHKDEFKVIKFRFSIENQEPYGLFIEVPTITEQIILGFLLSNKLYKFNEAMDRSFERAFKTENPKFPEYTILREFIKLKNELLDDELTFLSFLDLSEKDKNEEYLRISSERELIKGLEPESFNKIFIDLYKDYYLYRKLTNL